MNVTLKLYASLSDYLPIEAQKNNQIKLEVEGSTTVGSLIGRYNLPLKLVHLVLVNGVYVPPAERESRQLQEGDMLAIWPPVAGG